ncbi:MAG: tRNA (adenosine(37)-N6)-threonylcarbamoyltransferase complex ATPase subunit type 1 TsaE [Thermoanaerobaculia bacterium]|nr:tRNA (adenosine(37)-N6)-threonylcarbamoyltransferase complex ATPase subunit type 1 TsaE [Thermoanaerobaculia bacterium]
MRRWTTRTAEETRELGRRLARELEPDGILLLEGDLGAGKTVLVQGLGGGLGIPEEQIQSPSYTLVRRHQGPERSLIHVDLYRLEPEEALGLGLEEILESPGIKVFEWADRLPFALDEALRLRITRTREGERIVEEL